MSAVQTLAYQPQYDAYQASYASLSNELETEGLSQKEYMDFQVIVREVCALLKRNVTEFRDALFYIEEHSKKKWDESVQNQLQSMRSWTGTASKLAGVGTSVLSALPHIHPPLIEGAVTHLATNGFIPDLLGRFGGDMNKLAKAAASVIGSVDAVHKHFDNFNQTRLEADRTEHSSGANLYQESHQKHTNYRQEYMKKTQEMIDSVSSLERSILQSIQAMIRG